MNLPVADHTLGKVPKIVEMPLRQRRSLPGRWLPRLVLAAIGGLAYAVVLRPWLSHWSASVEEASTPLSGDHLQRGQGRGGFYTYDRLEHVVGTAIRSANHIVPELQQLALGDTVPLPPVPTSWAMDWTWSITLRPMFDGATRLLVRTRANYRPQGFLAPAMAPVLEPTHFVMERGMWVGIKRRAEYAGVAPITDVSRSRGNPAQLGSRDPESLGWPATSDGE